MMNCVFLSRRSWRWRPSTRTSWERRGRATSGHYGCIHGVWSRSACTDPDPLNSVQIRIRSTMYRSESVQRCTLYRSRCTDPDTLNRVQTGSAQQCTDAVPLNSVHIRIRSTVYISGSAQQCTIWIRSTLYRSGSAQQCTDPDQLNSVYRPNV